MECPQCGVEFEIFKVNQRFCKRDCAKKHWYRTNNVNGEYRKQYRNKHISKYKRWDRNSKLKSMYGLSEEDYTNIFDSQNGKCAICKKTSERFLQVDHDHETGIVRGLLCQKCNTGLGMFNDNALIVKSALEYVS